MRSEHRGFTLIELLIVIGIIGFLAAAILVAVDPVKRIQDARDSQRWSEVNSILNAILKKQVDDRALYNGVTGAVKDASTANGQIIVATQTGLADCSTAPTCTNVPGTIDTTAGLGCYVDLSGLVPNYLAEIPTDPNGGVAIHTGYYINWDAGNRIEIGACEPEQESTVSVKR